MARKVDREREIDVYVYIYIYVCALCLILTGRVFGSASVRQMRDVFIQTPSMSTHMVGFVVNKFERTASGGDSAIYTYTHADYSNRVQYVSGEAPRLLKAMEDFTELKYQLPKLDLFAVPDFKSDAMANWGLTTYR